MSLPFQLGNQQFNVLADRIDETREGLILRGAQAHVNLPKSPTSYYRHGWQSWSLVAWQAVDTQVPAQKPALLRPMQTDPLYANHPAPNGSGVGAVDFEDGKILLLGALGLDSHVAYHDNRLHGWYESGSGEWFAGYGHEVEVFGHYADILGKRFGRSAGKPAPRVWCSWYSLYTAIDEGILHNIFDELGDLPFDVLQIDDGWQVAIGDWNANEKFSSGMAALAEKIKSKGRTAGLWLAPLIAVESSQLAREHPDWFVMDEKGTFISAGFNWGEPLYALDTTHPAALHWLSALMKRVRGWGFDYLKLDFLYAGALPGVRHTDIPREAAYRRGLKALREGMGDDAYFLTCGAPVLPSLGLCDAIRVGPDVSGEWESRRDTVLLENPATPGTKNAIRATVNRQWLRPLVATDPDVVYFESQHNRLTDKEKRLLQDLALVCNFKATSDLPQWWSESEREEVRNFLEANPRIQRKGRYNFELDGRAVDFSPAMPLPAPLRGFDRLAGALTGWLGNQGWAIRLLNRFNQRALEKMKDNL